MFEGKQWRDLETLMNTGKDNDAVLSVQYFYVLRNNGYGALPTAPFSYQKQDIAGFGFANNTDLIQKELSCGDSLDVAIGFNRL